MKTSLVKRGGALMLSVMVFFAFTVAATFNVSAASTKTFYVVTKFVSSYSHKDSNGTDSGKHTETITYGSDGLGKSSISKDSGGTKVKNVYTRNKKGYVTKVKHYVDGKLSGTTKYTRNSNGDITSDKSYDAKGKLTSSITYTYWKKDVEKKYVYKAYENGKLTNTYSETYEKKGGLKTSKWTEGNCTSSSTYKNTYDKNDNVTKQVETQTQKYDGTTTKSVNTTTNKYTYNKKGLITKCVTKTITKENGATTSTTTGTKTIKYNSAGYETKNTYSEKTTYADGSTGSYKETNTLKYKKVKVAKKYWGLFGA